MGYQRRKTYLLVFNDEEYEGLEIRMRPLRVGEVLDSTADDVTRTLANMMDQFASSLMSWNLEDENGAPIPPTIEGVRDQDTDFIMTAYNAWHAQMAGEIAGPKDVNSNDGQPSLVASIPMEELSPSLAI